MKIGPQVDEPEKKLRKFGDTLDQTFAKLTKARDYKGLRLFSQQALDAGAKARQLGHADWGTAFDRVAKAIIKTESNSRTSSRTSACCELTRRPRWVR